MARRRQPRPRGRLAHDHETTLGSMPWSWALIDRGPQMLHIPSVEEWWRLTDKYPEFRQPSNLTLKEYGYMKLFELIEEHRPERVLEYGHGFSGKLFEYCL